MNQKLYEKGERLKSLTDKIPRFWLNALLGNEFLGSLFLDVQTQNAFEFCELIQYFHLSRFTHTILFVYHYLVLIHIHTYLI